MIELFTLLLKPFRNILYCKQPEGTLILLELVKNVFVVELVKNIFIINAFEEHFITWTDTNIFIISTFKVHLLLETVKKIAIVRTLNKRFSLLKTLDSFYSDWEEVFPPSGKSFFHLT